MIVAVVIILVAGVAVTPDRILDALLTMLAAETDRGRGFWRRAIGEIRIRPACEGWLCNWYVEPQGEPDAVARIEEVVRRLRDDHPRVHSA